MSIPARPAVLSPTVIVSLTTISTRLATVSRTVRSLLAQDFPGFRIRLHLSRAPFLLDEGVIGDLPADLTGLAHADPRLEIRFTANLGPYRKILPVLAELQGRRALIATADDDTVYPSDWLSGLVSAYRDQACVVAYRGHRMVRQNRKFLQYRKWMRACIQRNPDLYNLPTGKDGVLYDTSVFDPRVLDYTRALEIAPTADDLWLKWHYSALRDVPAFIIRPNWKAKTLANDDFGVSLYRNFNSTGGNDDTIQRLEDYTTTLVNRPFAARL